MAEVCVYVCVFSFLQSTVTVHFGLDKNWDKNKLFNGTIKPILMAYAIWPSFPL